ncbi:retrovirus-related Pol polyprotein from transposon 412 [Trichonephila clavipes]|nr:retrovirus-related Pol polyprotein from transposon 412 [Trichonephila clavipes]
MKTRYDTKATGHQFKEGDKVWFYNPTRRKGLSPKLQSHWDGPYTILKIINDVVIRILFTTLRFVTDRAYLRSFRKTSWTVSKISQNRHSYAATLEHEMSQDIMFDYMSNRITSSIFAMGRPTGSKL